MIYELQEKGESITEIGRLLGRDRSTISRELRRNEDGRFGEYMPDTAGRKAEKRRKAGRKRSYLAKDQELKGYVLEGLYTGWAPEEISGRLRIESSGRYLNHESIYQYVYSPEGRRENLRQYLRRSQRVRRKRRGRKNHRGKIPNRLDISQRPIAVEGREEFGHWEGDSVIYRGHSQCLSTQVERKSRYLIILHPENGTAAERTAVINRRFGELPFAARKTMTFDNGLEFAGHEAMTKALQMVVYFAKPYSSWQRGTNENTNGLIRWYLPKQTDLFSLPKRTIQEVESALNNRPRKCLGYLTPAEVMAQELEKISSA